MASNWTEKCTYQQLFNFPLKQRYVKYLFTISSVSNPY